MEDASCAEQGLQPGFCDKGMLSTMLSASLLIGDAGSEFVPLRDAPCTWWNDIYLFSLQAANCVRDHWMRARRHGCFCHDWRASWSCRPTCEQRSSSTSFHT